MKIVDFDDTDWQLDHPLGSIAFHHMLHGEPDSPDNFMFIVGRQDADFNMPRHRHNFDQIRLPLRGDMNIGNGLVLREGEVGYFPEGLPYGPQVDPLGDAEPGERLQLVLQFGGASGYGFMSIEQRRRARAEMARAGRFDGNIYHYPDGRTQWGLSAIWEHVFGVPLRYPHPRYKGVIIADPGRFHWLPVHDSPGVEHKFMGSFSERGVWIEMVRISGEDRWVSEDTSARRLLVVLSGTGEVAGRKISWLSALQVERHERLELIAGSELELFLVGLPPVELPAAASDAYDLEEMPSGEPEIAG